MIRRVSFRKAIVAGIAGAFAWEIVIRILAALELPIFDIVHTLGTLIATGGAAHWWPIGMALHAMLGAIWAVFYAYFFWSTFDYHPAVQGLIFSIIPTVLAGLIMIPQLGYMHPAVAQGVIPFPGIFARHWGWGGPTGDIIGHAVYGVTLGSLYRRPVGYPVTFNPLANA
jgi:hypothetical protein